MNCGWSGPFDIVAHSMGTCIVRYLLEVIDGEVRAHAVRQLIGLGPPNNGSALAELFNDPERGEAIINRLTGVFVPEGFDPSSDLMVQDVRPKSPVMRTLRTAGLRPDVTYRVIVTTNPEDAPGFFPWFEGKTWEIAGDGQYRRSSPAMGWWLTGSLSSRGYPLISLPRPAILRSICRPWTSIVISTSPNLSWS